MVARRCRLRSRRSGLEVVKIVIVIRWLGVKDVKTTTAARRRLLASSSRRWGRLVVAKVKQILFRLFRFRRLGLLCSGARRTRSTSRRRSRICFVVLIVFIELAAASTSGILEVIRCTPKPTSVTINTSTVSTVPQAVAAKTSIPAAAIRQAAPDAHATFEAAEFISVGPSLLSFRTDKIDITKQFHQFGRPVAHVDTLVLPILIDIMELAKHAKQRHVGPRIVDHSFRSVLNKKFQKLKTLQHTNHN